MRFVLVATPGGLEVGGDSVQAAGQPEPERITLVDEDPRVHRRPQMWVSVGGDQQPEQGVLPLILFLP